MNTFNESAKITEAQEEQIQGGLKSALQENAYGVVASVTTDEQQESVSPWTITF